MLFFTTIGQRVNQKPVLNDIIYYFFREVTRIYIKCRRKIWATHTDADPFKITHVDPAKINNISGIDYGYSGEVRSGDWDQSTETFMEENPVAKSIKLHFNTDVPWHETPLYEEFQHELDTRGDAWGYESMDDFEDRCRELEELYQSLATNGYLTHRQIYRKNRKLIHSKNNDGIHPNVHEINVDVGRDGQLLWRRIGQNRLAIAKILDLDKVPVRILVRHTEWQQIRDAIRSGNRRPIDHPDLNDIVRKGATKRSSGF
jgi:hypothetical protein